MSPRRSDLVGLFRIKYKDRQTGEKKPCKTWFFKVKGRRFRTGTSDASVAQAMRLAKLHEASQGRMVMPSAERVKVEDLEKLLIQDYAASGKRTTAKELAGRFRPLKEHFGTARCVDLTLAEFNGYVTKRKETAAPATIQCELACLRRAWVLAKESRKLPDVPPFPRLEFDNARRVFIERATFELLRSHLPDYLVPVVETGLLTGWRKEAILSRERRHVDLQERWLFLDPLWAKNKDGLTVSLNGPLWDIFHGQDEIAQRLERETGRLIPWCFFYREGKINYRPGDRIRSMEWAWNEARLAVGMPGLRFHDLRRGAIRTLRRSGASEHEIMEWVGLKTRSVFDRYDIVDGERLREIGARQEAYYREQAGKVAAIKAKF